MAFPDLFNEHIFQSEQKTSELNRQEIVRRQRTLMTLYINFKAEVQHSKTQLKGFCSEAELSEMIEVIREFEKKNI